MLALRPFSYIGEASRYRTALGGVPGPAPFLRSNTQSYSVLYAMGTINKVAELRRKRFLTQAELAKLCDTTQQQISKLESGKKELTWQWMRRLAIGLRCHPMDLVNWP